MRKMIATVIALAVLGTASACQNKSVITFYDDKGNITKTVESSGSDYDSHTDSRVNFKAEDTKKVKGQADALARVAGAIPEELPESTKALLLDDIAEAIAALESQDYGELPPMTWVEGIAKISKTLVDGTVLWFTISTAGDVLEAGIDSAGTKTSSVNNSTNIGASSDNGSSTSINIDRSNTTDVSTDIHNQLGD